MRPGCVPGSIDNRIESANHMIMDDMNDRMSRCEADMSTIKGDNAELKHFVSLIMTDVAVLKNDVAALKADVAGLTTDVAALKADVAIIRSTYVTKADLTQLEATLLKWYVGSFFTMTGLMIAAIRYLR